MTGWEWAVALVTMGCGALLQGAVGFGGNLIAAPIILLLDDQLIPGSLIFCAVALNLCIAVRERSGFDRRTVGTALVGRVPGTVLGVAAVSALSREGLSVVFGVLLLAAVLISWRGFRVRQTPVTTVAAGFASGLSATVTAVGGPPMALLMADDTGKRLRGTLSGFFFVGSVVSLLALAIGGEFDVEDLRRGLMLLPGTLVGFGLSRRLAPLLDRGYTRPVVLIVSGVGALMVLVRVAL